MKKYSLGIDLGTSNSAIAVTCVDDSANTETLPVIQNLGPRVIGDGATFASSLYLTHDREFPEGSFALPWDEFNAGKRLVGNFAREHGALVPDRLVSSAKSWLCNPHINHKEALLPWRTEIAVDKISPWDCSRLYLEHLKCAFLYQGQNREMDWNLENTEIVLTVPASFDDVARNLTHEAAKAAGLGEVVLLEEPQAAFYAWLENLGTEWRSVVRPGDVILVCDVGGGTSDFSLIGVGDQDGDLELERICVGEHILLGGDNMDLALAYHLRHMLESDGKSIDDWQFLALIQGARIGKEVLFSQADKEAYEISVPNRGSSLIGSMLSVSLTRSLLEQVVLDGFIPIAYVDDMPEQRTDSGLQEFGLPYATDPALSKHLARFLKRCHQNVKSNAALAERYASHIEGSYFKPTAVLFNGGVFKATRVKERVLELLSNWDEKHNVRELEGAELDLAVACGASSYGCTKVSGKGIRIKAGASHSYYIGLESSSLAVPGFKPPVKALCVVSQGLEEGSECLVESKEFGLVTGETTKFRFFSSSVRAGDEIGFVVPDAERELEESNELQMVLPALDDRAFGEIVPVKLVTRVTELGTLELWMQHTRSDQKWKLEFNVRTA